MKPLHSRAAVRAPTSGTVPMGAAIGGIVLLLTALAVAAADTARVHRLRIADQGPPCSGQPAGMPVIPNDPAAVTVAGRERRCYGDEPPQTELWLPDGRFVWLARPAPGVAAWIAVGTEPVDPAAAAAPPLGLRVIDTAGAVSLETRYGADASLTPLERGRWQPVRSADGSRFWVRLETAESGPP